MKMLHGRSGIASSKRVQGSRTGARSGAVETATSSALTSTKPATITGHFRAAENPGNSTIRPRSRFLLEDPFLRCLEPAARVGGIRADGRMRQQAEREPPLPGQDSHADGTFGTDDRGAAPCSVGIRQEHSGRGPSAEIREGAGQPTGFAKRDPGEDSRADASDPSAKIEGGPSHPMLFPSKSKEDRLVDLRRPGFRRGRYFDAGNVIRVRVLQRDAAA